MQKKPTVRVEIDAVKTLFVIWMLIGKNSIFLRSELTDAIRERAKQVKLTEDEFVMQTTGYMSLPSLMGALGASMMHRGYLDREDVGKYRILPTILETLKTMTNTNPLVADVVAPPADEVLEEEEDLDQNEEEEEPELIYCLPSAILAFGFPGMGRWVRPEHRTGGPPRFVVKSDFPATPELIEKMVQLGVLKRVQLPNRSKCEYVVEFDAFDISPGNSINRWSLERLKMDHPLPPHEGKDDLEQPSLADIDAAIARLEERDEEIGQEIGRLPTVAVIDAKIQELTTEVRRLQAEREKVQELQARSATLAPVIRVVQRVRHDDEQRMMRQNAEDNSLLLIENEMENQAKLLGKTPAEMLALLQARFVAAGK